MTLTARLHHLARAAACPTPPQRLRILYWCALALIACLLVLLHISIAGERRLSAELAAATRAELSVPHVLIVRVPPPAMRAAKAAHNTHGAPLRIVSVRRKEK